VGGLNTMNQWCNLAGTTSICIHSSTADTFSKKL